MFFTDRRTLFARVVRRVIVGLLPRGANTVKRVVYVSRGLRGAYPGDPDDWLWEQALLKEPLFFEFIIFHRLPAPPTGYTVYGHTRPYRVMCPAKERIRALRVYLCETRRIASMVIIIIIIIIVEGCKTDGGQLAFYACALCGAEKTLETCSCITNLIRRKTGFYYYYYYSRVHRLHTCDRYAKREIGFRDTSEAVLGFFFSFRTADRHVLCRRQARIQGGRP